MSSVEELDIAGFRVLFSKSQRAKHILLKQNQHGEIVLTCPKYCPKIMAVAFAKKQVAWIRAHVQHGPKVKVFVPNEEITIVGQPYRLIHGEHTEEKPGCLTLSGDLTFFHRRVCSFAQKKLLSYIQNEVSRLTKKINVTAHRITLRNTSSRWGSCSSTKNLSFCWKIAFAPKEVIDYLIAHEVAHLAEMNHSDRFWAVVDELTDTRKVGDKWLKQNGRMLQGIK